MKNCGDLVKELRELHREELALYLVPENHGKSKCVGWVRVDLLKESADAVAALDANVTLLGASMSSMQKQIDGLEALLVDSEAEIARLKEALKPFSAALDDVIGEPDALDNQVIWDTDACQTIKVGDLRRARVALSGQTGESA